MPYARSPNRAARIRGQLIWREPSKGVVHCTRESSESYEEHGQDIMAEQDASGGMAELANRFKRARRCFKLQKMSNYQEGAREVGAMVKTHFTKLGLEHLARVGPVGPDEQ